MMKGIATGTIMSLVFRNTKVPGRAKFNFSVVNVQISAIIQILSLAFVIGCT